MDALRVMQPEPQMDAKVDLLDWNTQPDGSVDLSYFCILWKG